VPVSSRTELTDVDNGGVVTRQPLSAEMPRQYSKLDMTVSFDEQVTGGAPLEDRRTAPEFRIGSSNVRSACSEAAGKEDLAP